MKKYIVELYENCWLATWSGDPGRTHVKESAKKYKTSSGAKIVLGMAHRNRPFPNAVISEVND